MAVVLNQADLLSPRDVEAWRADVGRLLAEDGVRGAPLLVVSAETGEGLDELRRLLEERPGARRRGRAPRGGRGRRRGGARSRVRRRTRGRDSARRSRPPHRRARERGESPPSSAVAAAHRRRGALATGWPVVRWVARLRPDPLRRLRLPETPSPAVRTSLPRPTDVQTAQVATAARRLADRAAEGLPEPWPRLVRDAATARDTEVADRLDKAVSGADLHASRPRWWSVASLVQKALMLAVLAGGLWLLVLACSATSAWTRSYRSRRRTAFRSRPGCSPAARSPGSSSRSSRAL